MTRVLIALLLAMSVPMAASAKPLTKIIAQTGLSPEDFDLMRAAERTLVAPARPTPGTDAAWENPETGSNGTVQLMSVREGCAYLRHRFHPKDKTATEELKYRLCKSPDGVWRLTP